jgi:hypothetical protein
MVKIQVNNNPGGMMPQIEFYYRLNLDTKLRVTANVIPGVPGRAPSLTRQGEAEAEPEAEILTVNLVDPMDDDVEIHFGTDDILVSLPYGQSMTLEEALAETAVDTYKDTL